MDLFWTHFWFITACAGVLMHMDGGLERKTHIEKS